MRLPVPGPGELVRALRELTSTLAGVAPGLARALALVPRVEELLARVDTVVSDVERTAGQAGSAVRRADELLAAAGSAVRGTDELLAAAGSAVRRADELLAAYEEPLRELAPTARRLAETMDPAEVEAAVSLVDRLPRLLDAVDRDLLPMLTQLQAVGPDVHELLDIVDDVRRMLAGLPGVALLRRDG